MQLDAYHVRRGFVQKTANKVVYNDGKRLLFAYPFLDVAALMDLLYISRSSAVRHAVLSTVKSTTIAGSTPEYMSTDREEHLLLVGTVYSRLICEFLVQSVSISL